MFSRFCVHSTSQTDLIPRRKASLKWHGQRLSRRFFFCFGLGGSIRTGTSKPIVRLLQLRTCSEWSTDYHFSRIRTD